MTKLENGIIKRKFRCTECDKVFLNPKTFHTHQETTKHRSYEAWII